MSVSFELVTGNPNPKVMSFRVHKNIMGDFAKLVVPKDSDLVNHVPLARIFFQNATGNNGGDFNRVDLACEEQGSTLVTLSRKLVPWGPGAKAGAINILQQVLDNEILCVDHEEVLKHTTPIKRFQPGNDAVKQLVYHSFRDKIDPLLLQHGGAMELMQVEWDEKAGIYAHAALIGSCDGCNGAGNTIAGATRAIRDVLEAAKRQNPDNKKLQSLTFEEMSVTQVNGIALMP